MSTCCTSGWFPMHRPAASFAGIVTAEVGFRSFEMVRNEEALDRITAR
jgi:hypothetical protein